MGATFTGHLVKMLKDAGMMVIQVHGGEQYTVDAIPGVKRSSLLEVVKEPSAKTIDMVRIKTKPSLLGSTYEDEAIGPDMPEELYWTGDGGSGPE